MPRGYKNNGEKIIPPSQKGKKKNPESVEKGASKVRGIKRPQVSGEKNAMWKGGITADRKEYITKRRKTIREQMAGRKQPEQCEICGAFGKICFDHNHETGKFRGWICMRCNTALGLVKENTETLMALIKYIRKNR